MTNELAQQITGDELTVLPPAQALHPTSMQQLQQHVEAMQTAHKLAGAMCRTTLVPDLYRVGSQPNRDRNDDEVIGNGTAAILYGMELGLNPIQSLQQVFPVKGQPGIYARTAVALLKRRGYRIWTESSADDSVTVIGEGTDGTVEGSTWTIERAERAGYVPTIDPKTGEYAKNRWGKLIGNEKYLSDPQAMLYAKAAMEVCRKLAPDVLMGIGDRDDAAITADEDEQPRRIANAPSVDDMRARLGRGSQPAETAETDPVETAPEPAQRKAPAKKAAAKKAAPKAAEKVNDPGDQPPLPDEEPASESGAKPDTAQVTEVGQNSQGQEAITDPQLKKLHVLMTKEGLTDRAEALSWLSTNLKREIATSKDLSKSEAHNLIEQLEAWQSEDAGKGGN